MRTTLLSLLVAVLALAAACGDGSEDVEPAPGAPVTTATPTTGPDPEPTTPDDTLPVLDDTGGGGSSTSGEELEAELARARERWAVSGLEQYTVELGVVCFCPVELAGPFVVTVDAGAITAIAYADSALASGDIPPGAAVLTVDQVFDEIETWIGQADEVRVTYDADTGIPTDVWIDPSFQMADEELGYTLALIEPA